LARAGDLVRATAPVRQGTAPGKVEANIEPALSSLFYQETRRRPVVTVALTEV
jgi:mRNA degradation ribonuclease J1/J2